MRVSSGSLLMGAGVPPSAASINPIRAAFAKGKSKK
jgi:hypothetical protein